MSERKSLNSNNDSAIGSPTRSINLPYIDDDQPSQPLLGKSNVNAVEEDYDEDEPHEVRADEFQHAPKPVMEDEFIPDPRAEKSLGSKDISTFLSIIYIINQIYGPGVLAIPIVFQQAGWLPTLASLTFFCVVSCLASTFICEAIALVPKNQHFTHRIEFTTVIKYYYGKWWHIVFQIFINITLQSYNIASIIITAQAFDSFFATYFGKTFALAFYPDPGFHAFTDSSVLYDGTYALTLGYVVSCIIVIPMGMVNLDSNVKTVQTTSFVFLILLFAEFVSYFIYQGPTFENRVSTFGVEKNYTQLASIFIFSWAYPMFVPSWVNEKMPHVSVNKVIWISGIASLIGYFFIGGLCALASANIDTDNMLTVLQGPLIPENTFHRITRVAAYLFSLGVIAPGIPVCSITTRYNLYVGRICGRKQSYWWGVIAPWVVGILFCQGSMFANLLNWTSLIFNGVVNFIVPMIVYVTAVRRRGESHSIVHPLPRFLQKYARKFAIGLACVTTIAIIAQIVTILVYQFAFGINILSQ